MNATAPVVTKTEAKEWEHLSIRQQKALETRQRRGPEYARQREVDKAMKLYSADRIAARTTGSVYPNITDYLARNECKLSIATEWAKGRFGELKGR